MGLRDSADPELRISATARGCPGKFLGATEATLAARLAFTIVMPGLVTGIHVLRAAQEGRGWPGLPTRS